MNIEEIREFALSLPHVTEDMPFGPDALALRIGGKIFCLLELSGHWQFYNLKVDPDFSLELQDWYSSFRPGFHMNKRHWISLDFNSSIPIDIEENIIRHAFSLSDPSLSDYMRGELGFE